MANKKSTRAAFIAGMSGTVLQWYDFTLFGFLSPVIAQQFFPTSNTYVALLSTFGVFAVGFILAPLGAIVFGHIGDRLGRKRALSMTILLMTIPTTLIAFIPNYQHIGILAPILLTLCRLMQGFVASAEFSGSAIFLIEHASPNRKSFAGSLTASGYTIGLILAALTSAAATAKYMPEWAWRIPFFLAIFGGSIVYYLRTNVSETPEFLAAKAAQQTAKYPLLKTIKENPRAIIATLGFSCFIAIVTYTCYVFMPTYLAQVSQLSLPRAIFIVSVALGTNAIIEPVFALLAERVHRQLSIVIGAILMLIFILPIFQALSSGNDTQIFIGMISLAVLIALTFATSNATLAYLFPPHCRYSGMGSAFNISMALFGGTAPLVCTWLINTSQNNLAPAFYLIASLLIGLITLPLIIRTTVKEPEQSVATS